MQAEIEKAFGAEKAFGVSEGPRLRRPRTPLAPSDLQPEPIETVYPSRGSETGFSRKDASRAARGRGSMDALREEALRNVITRAGDKKDSRSSGYKRPFPLGRVLLAAIALIAGGAAAYLSVQTSKAPEPVVERVTEVVPEPKVQVLVAKAAIDVGQQLSTDALEWKEWPESALLPEYITVAAAPDAASEMSQFVARITILPGEPIREDKLVEDGQNYLATVLGPGMRGVSVTVDAESASGGFVMPNDRVDVMLTRVAGQSQVTDIILESVRVLAIDDRLGLARSESEGEDEKDDGIEIFSSSAIATLELDPEQAKLIIGATTIGKLSLVLRSSADIASTSSAEQRSLNQSIRVSSPFWTDSPDVE
jgi:pilus assembly protein CpaB